MNQSESVDLSTDMLADERGANPIQPSAFTIYDMSRIRAAMMEFMDYLKTVYSDQTQTEDSEVA